MLKLNRETFKGQLGNLSLIVLTAIPFTIFAYRAAHVSELSGLTFKPVATLAEGTVEKRVIGADDLRAVNPGERFYDRDAIWVGPAKKAKFKLATGKEILIAENTSIVFREPFGDSYDDIESSVEVIRGEFVSDQKTFHSSASSSVSTEKVAVKDIYPADDALFYYRPGVVPEVVFSVGSAINEIKTTHKSAILLLRDADQKMAVRYLPLPPEGQLKVTLALDQRYTWQVIDSDRKTIAGPYPFETKSLAVGQESELLQHTVDPRARPVVTFW